MIILLSLSLLYHNKFKNLGKTEKEKEAGLRLQEKGTLMFLKLCRDVMNLEQLIQNNTVMGALTRVLQEEYKKSMELTFNILRYDDDCDDDDHDDNDDGGMMMITMMVV